MDIIDLSEYCYDSTKEFDISTTSTDFNGEKELKKSLIEKTQENFQIINDLQAKLFAESKESVLICLQALDAAGKDSVIKHVFSCVNPLGLNIYNYRTPSVEEASHDFLWRYHKNLPAKGKIAIFNRSYYEEVLVVKVHEDYKKYKVPERVLKGDYIKQKYKDINSWEKYLYGNGTRIIKIFLNVSKETQKKRFLERIEREDKHWKFSANDIKERAFFEKYQEAFESAINNTSTKQCPWYVLPADQKWFTRFLVSELLVKELSAINPDFPKITEAQKQSLEECKILLENETN